MIIKKKKKKINNGKRFEEDFIGSLPENVYRLRLKDAGGWSNATNTRFTIKNPCDFIIQSEGNELSMIELKSHKGKSVPYDVFKQYDDLVKFQDDYSFIYCGAVFNFSDLEETYLISIDNLKIIKERSNRKSFGYDDVRELGILILQKKKITRWTYDLVDLF